MDSKNNVSNSNNDDSLNSSLGVVQSSNDDALPNSNLSDSQSDLVSLSKNFLQQKTKKTDSNQKSAIGVKGISNILDAVLSKGLIDIDQYNSIKFESVNTGKTIEKILLEQNIVDEKELARINAEMRGFSFADLLNMNIDSDTINLLPQSIARANKAVVFESLPNKVKVAMKDPLDLQKIQYLESILKKRIEPFYASESDIKRIIDTRYGAEINKEVTEALEDIGEYDLNKAKKEAENSDGQDAPIIRLVNMILDYGIKNKASDIHIEPRETKVAVRFRIRGILTEKLTIPKKLHPAVVARIKILSNLKIDEHRIPQDGRFPVKNNDVSIDVRVSVMPSLYGEKIVLRLLEKSSGIMKLEETGIRGISYTRLKEALKKTQGLILVTGPTGSGKTQTVASCLDIINSPEVNIITLEDPVEIRIEGINQTQVNPEVGLTFATGLRSILRQDPDIIFVGEIRDGETAALAVQAALVGRLVLSTLHTNSAAGVFPRLLDMGVEVFLLTSTINVALGQRLVRTLCEECKEPYKAPDNILKILHSELDVLGNLTVYDEAKHVKAHFDKNTNDVTLYKPVGCPKCNDTGFNGRIGIFECLEMSESIKKAVVQKRSISEIQDIAVKEGMITMAQDGFIRVLEGVTTIEEVLRVKNE
ncbi:MAG: hypothetical protein KatS3mg085_388 [Candidatus Dojkabacteria bacterium]|nr:MAG: hypothetical protein KatS3mg085_388 [Candidatus Dojkabacteria bacterium]